MAAVEEEYALAPVVVDRVRALDPEQEPMRAEMDDGSLVAHGYMVRWGDVAEINNRMEGHFQERFEPEAFDKTVRENKNVKILFQHGKDPQVGFKVIGSPRLLERDELGLRYEIDLFEDAPYVSDNVLPGLKRGEYGVSFTWRMLKHKDTPAPRGGLLQRSVTEAYLREFGPVTFPYYKGSTIKMRSLTDEFVLGHLTDAETPLWLPREEQEPEPPAESDEATTPPDPETPDGEPEAGRSDEPEPSEATTQVRVRATPARDYLKRGKGQETWRL
jgi:HK97 family phage prohead protease